MVFKYNLNITLEEFDNIWDFGDPVIVEEKFKEFLSHASTLKDKSIYLQILS